jgi:hypothetical protein
MWVGTIEVVRGPGIVLAVCAGCSFSGNGGTSDDDTPGDDGTPVVDAPPGTPDAQRTFDAPVPPDALQVVCPGSYGFQFKGSRYRLSGLDQRTWQGAEQDCEDDTNGLWTHLPVFDDQDEWQWATGSLEILPGDSWFHIGVLRDAQSPQGPWRTVTGQPVFAMWRQTPGADEPNNGGLGEPVVVLDSGRDSANDPDVGGYIDVGTLQVTFYACECDGRAPVNASP